jgi:uncharacterized Zn finger protein (UPF0148 family)
MKILCPSCERLVELVDLRVERGALVVRCPSCKAEERQVLQAPAIQPPPSAPRGAEDDEGNDEGPTIILLTPSSDAVPLAIAPPGSEAPPSRPAAVARFDSPGPAKSSPVPAVAPLVAPAEVPEPPRRMVDAEFAQLLSQLGGVHPSRPPEPRPVPATGAGVVRGSTVQIPPGHCPKCITPRSREALLCPACGLVFANFRAEEHEPSAALESAWHGLEGRWEKPEEHDKFLQLAFNLDELAKAGRLYRIRLAQRPDDGQAKTALESMVRMASTAASLAARTDPAEIAKKRRKVLAVSAMLFFFIPIAALLANFLLRAH